MQSSEFSLPAAPDEILRMILDRRKIPEAIVHMLQGEVWIEYLKDGKVRGRWERRGEVLMNETGIRAFTPLIFSTVTPDKLATDISDDEVRRLTYEMMAAVVDMIEERGEEFGILPANRGYIVRLLEHNLFMGLTSSRNATILKTIERAYSARVSSPAMPQQAQGQAQEGLPNIFRR